MNVGLLNSIPNPSPLDQINPNYSSVSKINTKPPQE